MGLEMGRVYRVGVVFGVPVDNQRSGLHDLVSTTSRRRACRCVLADCRLGRVGGLELMPLLLGKLAPHLRSKLEGVRLLARDICGIYQDLHLSHQGRKI